MKKSFLALMVVAFMAMGCSTVPAGFAEPVEAPIVLVASCPPLYDNKVSAELYNQCRDEIMRQMEKPRKAPNFAALPMFR